MTNYERICADKAFCASVISSALHKANYEDDDFDPSVMNWLDFDQGKTINKTEETHD